MHLCDVTLREGNQMPGRAYTADQKIAAGKILDNIGVGSIQAGFPITGEVDKETVSTLSEQVDASVTGLARARSDDVRAAISANADVVDIFIPISDKQLNHSLGMGQSDALDALTNVVNMCTDTETAAQLTLADAFRADISTVIKVFDRFPDIKHITLADTVGARAHHSVEKYLQTLTENVNDERIGVHFHDDMGLATANALTALNAGVGRIDVSVASLGERAGNPALEEVIVAGDMEYNQSLVAKTTDVIPACQSIMEILDEDVAPKKAILGEEVTKHESGIHTAAMLETPDAFEPFNPAQYGGERTLIFGENTGRSGAQRLLSRAQIEPTTEQIDDFLKILAKEGPIETSEAVSLAMSKVDRDT